MWINEVVKGFLAPPRDTSKDSSEVSAQNVVDDLGSQDIYPYRGGFFDNEISVFGSTNAQKSLIKQKEKIMSYRQIAMTSEVDDALDEIVNEIIFSYDDKQPLKLRVNEENDKLSEAINNSFDKITKLMNVKRNLYSIVKNSYIDGQTILHCAFNKTNTSGGIQSIKMIEPAFFYFDGKSSTYKYYDAKDDDNFFDSSNNLKNEEYSPEEIVKEDFGLASDKITLSYLEYVIKPANQLQTLEDLLIPMRFSRSISRRVFNVDIGDLPNKRGKEVMSEYQNKFKYKKFYNAQSGEISNQQHITSMVEDYWFANRSGGKGTQVDTLDETGNLGELDDILYFNKKLYQAMKIPTSRIKMDPDADNDFDYDSTRVTKEDMKFFMFISRIRNVYSSLFKELLKREVITTNVMSESEWVDKEDLIEIYFANENKFIEKMKLDNFMAKIDIFSNTEEISGKVFSVERLLKEVFKFNDDEIKENLTEIQKEEKNPLYAKFYATEDDSY